MGRRAAACALAATLALAGCAQPPPPQVAGPPPKPEPKMVWDKAGATTQAFAADKFECIRQSQGMIIVNGNGAQIIKWPLFNLCMEGRGWVLVPEKVTP